MDGPESKRGNDISFKLFSRLEEFNGPVPKQVVEVVNERFGTGSAGHASHVRTIHEMISFVDNHGFLKSQDGGWSNQLGVFFRPDETEGRGLKANEKSFVLSASGEKIAENIKGKSVIDLACGPFYAGSAIRMLAKMTGAREYIGVDLDLGLEKRKSTGGGNHGHIAFKMPSGTSYQSSKDVIVNCNKGSLTDINFARMYDDGVIPYLWFQTELLSFVSRLSPGNNCFSLMGLCGNAKSGKSQNNLSDYYRLLTEELSRLMGYTDRLLLNNPDDAIITDNLKKEGFAGYSIGSANGGLTVWRKNIPEVSGTFETESSTEKNRACEKASEVASSSSIEEAKQYIRDCLVNARKRSGKKDKR